MSDFRLYELAQAILADRGAAPVAAIAAAWLVIHGDTRPLRKLVEEARPAPPEVSP